jgi:hypothetical protein
MTKKVKQTGPKVLLVDVETKPLLGYLWAMFDQNLAINQIHNDTSILSFSAKWLGAPDSEIIYMDQRGHRNLENDKTLVKVLWKLLDNADVVVGQNSKRFDVKRINARFIVHGMTPPSSFKQIDTMLLARKHFAFTSNKLEYLTNLLCVKHKKSTHKKFSGFELWKGCMEGNLDAWNEMESYNKKDVLSLEELYTKLIPWDNSVNFNLYSDTTENVCKCGSKKFKRNGFFYTEKSKFQRFKCSACGSETRDTKNLFTKEKSASIRVGTKR